MVECHQHFFKQFIGVHRKSLPFLIHNNSVTFIKYNRFGSYLQLFHKNFNRLKCVIGSKTVKTKTFSAVFFYCFGGGNLINPPKSSVLLDIKNGVVFRIIQNERQRTWVALKGTFLTGSVLCGNIRRKRIKISKCT